MKQNVHVAISIELDEHVDDEENVLKKWSELFEHATIINIPDWSDKDRMQLARHKLQPLKFLQVGAIKLWVQCYTTGNMKRDLGKANERNPRGIGAYLKR